MDTTMIPAAHGQIIDDAQHARRKSEVDFAQGSVRFKSGILSDGIERLNARYVAGEIGSDELTAAVPASETVRP